MPTLTVENPTRFALFCEALHDVLAVGERRVVSAEHAARIKTNVFRIHTDRTESDAERPDSDDVAAQPSSTAKTAPARATARRTKSVRGAKVVEQNAAPATEKR